MAKFRNQPNDDNRFYRSTKRSTATALPKGMNRNHSFSSLNSNQRAKGHQAKPKKEMKSHRNANSLPVLPQINIQIGGPTERGMNSDIAFGARSNSGV